LNKNNIKKEEKEVEMFDTIETVLHDISIKIKKKKQKKLDGIPIEDLDKSVIGVRG